MNMPRMPDERASALGSQQRGSAAASCESRPSEPPHSATRSWAGSGNATTKEWALRDPRPYESFCLWNFLDAVVDVQSEAPADTDHFVRTD